MNIKSCGRTFCLEILVDLRHITPQDGREIGIDHRRVAAANQLDQRRDLVADRYLRKTHLARQRRHLSFVIGMAVGVHENDRDRLDSVGLDGVQLPTHSREIGFTLHRAVGTDALVDFNNTLVEHVRLDDVAGKDFRPRLVADLQCVAEAFGDEQRGALALALEQRIGGDRRAHFHRADVPGRDCFSRLQAKQVADALHSGVGIGFGIFRQELVRDQRSVGRRPTTSVKVPPRSIQKSQSCR